MNKTKLKELEKKFLAKYPGGFENPYFKEMEKKHKMGKMVETAQTFFARENFKNTEEVIQNLAKIISRSSMVSMFEKPKFRDYVASLSSGDQKQLAEGLENMLHSDQKRGFETMLQILARGKIAKWSLMTAAGVYFSPEKEVFVKPTTAKGVIAFLELENLEYNPRPSWEFYREYRLQINEMKKEVSKSLSPSNAAFTGFLMMGLEN